MATLRKTEPQRLRPVYPNLGLAAAYRRQIEALVDEMARSTAFWIKVAYRKTPPLLAQDATPEDIDALVADLDKQAQAKIAGPAKVVLPSGLEIQQSVTGSIASGNLKRAFSVRFPGDAKPQKISKKALDLIIAQEKGETPAQALNEAVAEMAARWQRNFDEAAPRLARYFSTAVEKRSAKALEGILRDGGFSVRFKMTPAMQDVMDATIAENVGLIRTIPQQYFGEIEGMVMRSVQAGRDLGTLAKDLQSSYGVTKRRAALIARHQNNMATASMTRVRQMELGLKAIWKHSRTGKEPRPTHVANDGKLYDPAKGWFDPDKRVRRRIWPGELINCFPASTQIEFAPNVEKAYRRWYRGQLTEIITDSGKALRATPNHPILSAQGWVPIQQLREGDYVLEIAEKVVHPVVPESNKQNRHPEIVQIFDALAKARSPHSQVSLRNDFHGDGIAKGDVDIVRTEWSLSFGRDILREHGLQNVGLPMADEARASYGSLAQLGIRRLTTTNGGVGRPSQPAATGGSFALHANERRLVTISGNAAAGDDQVFNHGARQAVLAGQRQDADAAFMGILKPVRIARIRRQEFSGHVFNLENQRGWYVAGSLIAHNCRCQSMPVVPGFS